MTQDILPSRSFNNHDGSVPEVKHTRRITILYALLTVAVAMQFGCTAEKVSCENYERIRMGASLDQVRMVLGTEASQKPHLNKEGRDPVIIYTWRRKSGEYIEVGLKQGKVVMIKAAKGRSQPWCSQ
jgi:hypothetical protein